jgi:translation initiation factor IF-3
MVIDEQGDNVGQMSKSEALKLAQEKELDLIEISPNAKPPVARILDYGKYAYEQQKKDKKTRSTQKTQELKQIRIKFKTSDHDLQTKVRQVEKFLEKGNKVRVEIFLRGRERAFKDLAKERLESFIERIEGEFRTLDQIKGTPRGFATTIIK